MPTLSGLSNSQFNLALQIFPKGNIMDILWNDTIVIRTDVKNESRLKMVGLDRHSRGCRRDVCPAKETRLGGHQTHAYQWL